VLMIMITISFARNSLQNWFSSSIAITPCQALRKGDMLKISLLFYNSTISMCRYVIKCLPTILWFFPERTKLKISSKKKRSSDWPSLWRNLSQIREILDMFFPCWEGFGWVSHSVFQTWKKNRNCWKHDPRWWCDKNGGWIFAGQ